jgi:integrase
MSISKNIRNEIYELINLYIYNHDDNYTLSKINEIITKDNPKLSTISSRYSEVKKIFKQRIPNISSEFLKQIKPTLEITNEVYNKNKDARDKELIVEINEKTIRDIMEFRKSDNLYELLIYVLFISGRRISELYESEFHDVKGSNRVGINGVKKKHLNYDGCEFPVITNKNDFYNIMKIIRDMTKDSKLGAVNRGLNRYIKILLGDDFHTHMLRGMYAQYLYRFRNPEGVKINPFIQRVLCHTSIESSMAYTGYNYLFNNDIIKNMKI